MDSDIERGSSPPLDDDALTFHAIIYASLKYSKSQPAQFVKKLAEIPKVSLLHSTSRRKALALADGLISDFTRIWPSPKMVSL
jgi:hypothetical protein